MIARASDLHFQDSQQENLALWEKILLILDELFHLIEDCSTVIPRWTEEEEEAESNPSTPKIGLQRGKHMSKDSYTTGFLQ